MYKSSPNFWPIFSLEKFLLVCHSKVDKISVWLHFGRFKKYGQPGAEKVSFLFIAEMSPFL
jgi:hypothetical protein